MRATTKRNVVAGLSLATAMALSTESVSAQPEEPVEYDEFRLRIEINATDGGAGFHGIMDGEGWRRLTLRNPDGNKI